MYNFLFQKIIMPLSEFYSHTCIQKRLKFLKKSQYWSKKELLNYQNEQLKKIILHAYNNVPYYKELFDKNHINPKKIKNKKDLQKIPFLTKKIVRENFEKLKAKNYLKKGYVKFTSGSTGMPTNFFHYKDGYSWEWAAHFRAWGWAGYDLGDKYIKVSLGDDHHLIKKVIQDTLMRSLFLYVYEMDDNTLLKYVNKIIKFKPKFIYGYGSSISVIAQFMIKNNITYNAKGVITTGSKVLSKARKNIEKSFNCKVYDGYGCGGEGLNIAAQCEKGNYHINDELLILEEDKGEAVITSLTNYAMPLIRYKPDDFIKLGGSCNCGKNLSVLKSISGRSNEYIETKDHKILVVELIIGAFEYLPGIDQYKAIQYKPGEVIFQIVKNDKFEKKSHEEKIKKYLLPVAGKDFKIIFQYVKKIPLEKNGKTRIIERR